MRRLALLCLSIFLFTLNSFAVTSTSSTATFTFSGRLGSTSGVSLAGTAVVSMTASLYEQQTSGSALYMQTYTSVEVTNGFFSIEIGPALPTLSNAPYLELTVQGQLLSPRQKLIVMPFAIESIDSQTAQFATEAQNAITAQEAQNSQTLQRWSWFPYRFPSS